MKCKLYIVRWLDAILNRHNQLILDHLYRVELPFISTGRVHFPFWGVMYVVFILN